MREIENALPAATAERAVIVSLHAANNHCRRRFQGRSLDAAVIGLDHPEAERIARVVPDGAQLVKLGGSVVGYYKTARSAFSFRSRRAHEIELLFIYRPPATDGVLPLPEDEVAFAVALVAHAAPEEARAALVLWGVEMTPQVERILEDEQAWRRRFTASSLGLFLRLRDDERSMLGITTFRPAGQTDAEQIEARRARDRERKRAARARAGCGKARPISIEQLKPWRAEGMSRRDWYRKGRNKAALNLAASGTAGVQSKVRDKFAADTSSAKPARNDGDRILAAITEARTLRELEGLTGLKPSVISPWLSRLRKAGKAVRVGRGLWRATASATGGHEAAAPRLQTAPSRRPLREPGVRSENPIAISAAALRRLLRRAPNLSGYPCR